MKGATLIELVVTIVLLGILAAASAVILVPAFEAYFASQRRAQLADVADTALRRMVRDVRLALPNSPRARVDGANHFLEILLTRNGGRYRLANDNSPASTENPLDFSQPDDVFDTLGTLPAGPDQLVQANDYVVIHNLGIPGANAYDTSASSNIARISAFGAGALANENRITLTAANQFPLESPGRRFYVITGPVTFACVGPGLSGGNGTGTLRRWSGYPIDLRLVGGVPSAPNSLPPGATDAVLADNVSACEFSYTQVAHLSRGLVGIRITITRANEPVTLYYEAQINNVP